MFARLLCAVSVVALAAIAQPSYAAGTQQQKLMSATSQSQTTGQVTAPQASNQVTTKSGMKAKTAQTGKVSQRKMGRGRRMRRSDASRLS